VKPAAQSPARSTRSLPVRASLLALIPLLAALVASINTIPGDFVFDDAVVLQGDSLLQSFDLHRIFRENYWGRSRSSPNYRPLTLLSYALNYRLSAKAWGFHLINAALHCAVVGAFYLVARRLLVERWAAAAASTLYAVLPIHAEAVANIVGRAELLAALAVFLAWRLALRDEGDRPRTAVQVGALVLLGMLSKENAAVAVALIPISAYLLRRRLAWAATCGALAGVAAYGLLRWLLFEPGPIPAGLATLVDNPLARQPAILRILNATALLGLYGIRAVLPIHLSADHSYNELPVLQAGDPLLWLGAGGTLLALLLPLALLWRRAPAAAVGFAVFPAAFATTANVLLPIGTMFAERLAYLPSAGYPLGLLGILAHWTRGRPEGRLLALVLVSGLSLAYAGRSWIRNRDWADSATFDIRLAKDSPGSTRAHEKAAEGYVYLSRRTSEAGERERLLEKAERETEEALRIYPSNSSPRAFRALILSEREELPRALQALDQAEEAYRKEGVERDPSLDYLRAEILFKLGSPGEAVKALDAYLGRMGASAKAFNLLGACRMALRDPAAARGDLERAVALDPSNPVARMNLGIALAQLGRGEEARRELDAAVLLAPENPQVYSNRGFLRFSRGDAAGAVADYRSGLQAAARKGQWDTPRGESVVSFHERIFDVLRRSGDPEGARREIEALSSIPSPAAQSACRSLKEALEKAASRTGSPAPETGSPPNPSAPSAPALPGAPPAPPQAP
jgi:tetratricopeptide (TPR) repeat protein